MRFPIVLLTCLSVFSVFVSCSTDTLSDLSVDEYERILAAAVSPSTLPVDRFHELDPNASYYLALKTAEAGFTDAAAALARHCWESTSGLISERAAALAIKLQFDAGNFSEASFLASIAAAGFPYNYEFRRMITEAAYWRHRDASVLDTIDALQSFPESEQDYELYLFRAVSAFRLKSAGWEDLWVQMFMSVPASSFICRGWDYISAKTDDPLAFFPGYSQLFSAKYLQSAGKLSEAEAVYREFIENTGGTGLSPVIIEDLENLYLKNGGRARGAELLESLPDTASGENIFAAARLYRRAGRYADAERCMDELIGIIGPDSLHDRELWYSFDIKVRRNLTDALDSLDFYTSRWEDAEFFTDSLDLLCTNLASRRRWNSISELAHKLEQSGPASVYDRCRYISERAAVLGYIQDPGFTGPYTDLYYRILSGDSLDELRIDTDSVPIAAVCSSGYEDSLNEYEQFIDGMLKYDTGGILAETERYREHLSERFLVRCAGNIARKGNYLDSIRIMYRFEGRHSPSGLKALYPDFYRTEIEEAAEKSGIPAELMFAIVWKESGFEREIVSRSGAVGLSQLMPSTAEDVAGRMDYDLSDLTNPVDNLSIGTWYLQWLTNYVGNTAAAVISYNGGPGRVRGWQRTFAELPDDLLYEVVPVAETHLYGKKVLTASVLYGLLYYDLDPKDTLKIFFQEE